MFLVGQRQVWVTLGLGLGGEGAPKGSGQKRPGELLTSGSWMDIYVMWFCCCPSPGCGSVLRGLPSLLKVPHRNKDAGLFGASVNSVSLLGVRCRIDTDIPARFGSQRWGVQCWTKRIPCFRKGCGLAQLRTWGILVQGNERQSSSRPGFAFLHSYLDTTSLNISFSWVFVLYWSFPQS